LSRPHRDKKYFDITNTRLKADYLMLPARLIVSISGTEIAYLFFDEG
jgi:hypothetical protein